MKTTNFYCNIFNDLSYLYYTRNNITQNDFLINWDLNKVYTDDLFSYSSFINISILISNLFRSLKMNYISLLYCDGYTEINDPFQIKIYNYQKKFINNKTINLENYFMFEERINTDASYTDNPLKNQIIENYIFEFSIKNEKIKKIKFELIYITNSVEIDCYDYAVTKKLFNPCIYIDNILYKNTKYDFFQKYRCLYDLIK